METFNFGNIPNIPTVSRLMDRTAAPPAETNKHSNHEEKTGGSNVHAATFKQKSELVAERGVFCSNYNRVMEAPLLFKYIENSIYVGVVHV